MTAIAYLRVSTPEQGLSGLGLEAQRAAIATCALRLGVELRGEYVDILTGALAITDRPVLMEAVTALAKGDVLLVAKRDRLGRDALNVAMIQRLVERKHARIVSAAGEGSDDDGPTSVLMRQIIDAFAQYERALIQSRTKAALKAKKARGERVGGIPYGCSVTAEGKLIPNVEEQATLMIMHSMHANGQSTRTIATWLNGVGFLTRRGTHWRFQYVAQALRAA